MLYTHRNLRSVFWLDLFPFYFFAQFQWLYLVIFVFRATLKE